MSISGPAVKYSESINMGRSPPPCLAEHTNEILSSILHYTEDDIEGLRNSKVIF